MMVVTHEMGFARKVAQSRDLHGPGAIVEDATQGGLLRQAALRARAAVPGEDPASLKSRRRAASSAACGRRARRLRAASRPRLGAARRAYNPALRPSRRIDAATPYATRAPRAVAVSRRQAARRTRGGPSRPRRHRPSPPTYWHFVEVARALDAARARHARAAADLRAALDDGAPTGGDARSSSCRGPARSRRGRRRRPTSRTTAGSPRSRASSAASASASRRATARRSPRPIARRCCRCSTTG